MVRGAKVTASVLVSLTLGAGIATAGGTTKDCTVNPQPRCEGTDGDDEFVGEDVPDGVEGAKDLILGKGGSDGGEQPLGGGLGGDDVLRGGPGADGDNNLGVGDFEGGDGADEVSGGPGDDGEIEGDNGRDVVSGGAGDDREVNGESGNDEVFGGPGDDLVQGGDGDNTLHGGDGADRIEAFGSTVGDRELVFGDERRDDIKADDEQKDVIDCGTGEDTVTFDQGLDELSRCENRIPTSPS